MRKQLTIFYSGVTRLLLASYPIILAQVGTILIGISDSIMLGKVGKSEVAASGVANQLFFLFTSIGMGTLAVITSMVASSKGAKNNQECGEILRTGIELSFLISLVICIILFVIGENFHIFQQPEEITDIARNYLRILTISTIPLLLFITLKQYSEGLSLGKPAMVIMLVSVFINLLLNWVFIYGNLTFPAMGAYGAALATLISRIVMALLLVLYIFQCKYYKDFLPPLISTFKTRPLLKKMLNIGLPSGLQFFFEIGAFAGAAVFAGWIGTDQLAAHQIILGVSALTYMAASGISVGSSIYVADSFGKNNRREIIENGTVSFITIFFLMGASCLLFISFDEEIVSLFIKDSTVIKIGASIIFIAAIFQIFDGVQVVALGNLRGIEDVNKPTMITLIAYWIIALPSGYLLGFVFNLGVIGIWYGLLAGLAVSACMLTFRFYILTLTGRTKTYSEVILEKEVP